MPSVRTRRSTRVFVPKSVVKDAVAARVLRSGKRLWPESGVRKPRRGSDGNKWFRLLDHSSDADDVPRCKDDGWHEVLPGKVVAVMDLDGEMALPESVKNASGVSTADESVDKMYGTFYHRKRRMLALNRSISSSFPSESRDSGHRMYRIPFVREQQTKSPTGSVLAVFSRGKGVSEGNSECQVPMENFAPDVSVNSSCSNSYRLACFLNSILSYMRRSRIRLSVLAAFMCSEPIALVFSRNGIHFLHDPSCSYALEDNVSPSGICKIFGARRFIPLFSLDFPSVPFSFIYLHSSILLGSTYLPDVLVRYMMGLHTKAHSRECLPCISTEIELSGSKTTTSGNNYIKRREARFFGRAHKSVGRSASRKYGVYSHSVQKRSGLRSAKATNLLVDLSKSCSVIGADLLSNRDDCISFSSLVSNRKQRKSVCNGLGEDIKELKSTSVELRQNMDSLSCSANILVIESDKCFREEATEVALECTASNEWSIVVKTQGSLRYFHKVQSALIPSTFNRFTHTIMWTGESGWKLEFSDRREWFVFRQLHRECYDRNVQVVSVRIIPVPGVSEVPGYGDIKCIPFVRPETYIATNVDEVARALLKTTANYDIQSDDEELLNKLNDEIYDGGNCRNEHISADNFEKIIDVFEKTAYYSPDDVSDENKTISLCLNLGRRDSVAAIYNYWLKKREQKCLALIRVFQCHPPRTRRSQLVEKPFLRKKRSFKRKGSQYGRGKQPRFLQAMAAEHDVVADLRRVEEAKGSARRSLKVATFNRYRAQILMENADLVTYKAAIALKIAESARRTESQDVSAFSFLG